jgi:hypothetical protein
VDAAVELFKGPDQELVRVRQRLQGQYLSQAHASFALLVGALCSSNVPERSAAVMDAGGSEEGIWAVTVVSVRVAGVGHDVDRIVLLQRRTRIRVLVGFDLGLW